MSWWFLLSIVSQALASDAHRGIREGPSVDFQQFLMHSVCPVEQPLWTTLGDLLLIAAPTCTFGLQAQSLVKIEKNIC